MINMKNYKNIALAIFTTVAIISTTPIQVSAHTRVESTKSDTIAPALHTEKQNSLKQEPKQTDLEAKKAADKAEKERLKIEKAKNKRQKEIEKQAKRLEKQQKEREKAQKKYEKAVSKADKLESNIKKQISKIDKMQNNLDKKINKGKIEDIAREKEIIKISKEQIKLKELERDFEKAKNEVKKLR